MRVDINKADILAVKTMLTGIKGAYPRVMSRSINKTLTNVRVFAVKEIAKDLNLTQTRIKQDFYEDKASYSHLSGKVAAKGKPVGLISFKGTRQLKAGVKVKVHVSKSATTLKHAFITTASNAKNVFWRQYDAARSKYRPGFPYAKLPHKYRYPLERLTGPRIEDEYSKPKVLGPTMKHADDRIIVNMKSQIEFELSKL